MAAGEGLGTEPVADVLDELADARAAYEDATAAVTDHGEARLEQVADALDRARGLLDRYEGDATGTGDFQAYVEFQGAFESLVEGLPEDLPGRAAFERANDYVDQRRLSVDDFEDARAALADVESYTELLQDRETAAAAVNDARHAARRRLSTVEERIEGLERLQRFGDADLDAPTEAITEPIAAYDDAVREAFETFLTETPAREVLSTVAETTHYPLVSFQSPPPELQQYLTDSPVGEESIPTLLAYESYSASKLDHYVPDAGQFNARVSVHRAYLDRLGPAPLVVGAPPPAAGVLRARGEELVSVTAKFAPESVVARARQLPRIARRDDYERLRTAVRAETELDDEERERLQSGAVETELARLRDARDRLSTALDRQVLG
jgi:hypothetical protein